MATPQSISRIATNKVPPFWKVDPELWLYHIEAVIARGQMSSRLTKFQAAVTALEFDVLQQVSDIIKKPGTRPYEDLKNRLIQIYFESANRQIRQLLEGKQLRDEKPLQLLKHIMQLAGKHAQSEMLRSLWMRSLPTSDQHILAAMETTEVDELATIADRIHKVHRPTDMYAVTNDNLMIQQVRMQPDFKDDCLQSQISPLNKGNRGI